MIAPSRPSPAVDLALHAVPPQATLPQLRAWLERARQRRQLAGLSERELHDIGLSHAAAQAEARKPFWRP
jgi:uncharacterized protein YjiS (DUF1127 family)